MVSRTTLIRGFVVVAPTPPYGTGYSHRDPSCQTLLSTEILFLRQGFCVNLTRAKGLKRPIIHSPSCGTARRDATTRFGTNHKGQIARQQGRPSVCRALKRSLRVFS